MVSDTTLSGNDNNNVKWIIDEQNEILLYIPFLWYFTASCECSLKS